MEWTEANIVINGEELSYAESMTLRVAISSFLSEMKHSGLGNDKTGKAISEGYIRHSKEIIKKIHKS